MGFDWPKKIFNGVSEPKNGTKTIHIFLGFFFIVNFCLGIGALGIPYAFFYTGVLAAIPTLLVVSVVSWINANYLLEVMARAQALEYWENSQKPSSDSDEDENGGDTDSKSFLDSTNIPVSNHPRFEITTKRKFEIAELCCIFFNRYIKYIYLAILSMHGFMASWTYAAVAGSAWAINIPFKNFGGTAICSEDAFQHRVVPEGGCLNSYYFCLFLFAVIVVTLSMLDLKEQAYFQMVLGLMRFFTIAAIVIYCIVRLVQGGNPCDDFMDRPVLFSNVSIESIEPVNLDVRSVALKFDPRGWVVTVPVFTFSFLFHTGISSLTHPIRQKQYLHWLVMAMFISSLICYFSLGVTVSLWYRSSIQETCTLNWAVFIRSSTASLGLKIFSYYLILFPSFDVISAYPLITHTVVNNFYIIITGHDTSEKPKYRFDFFLRVFLRFTVALIPILAAFGVANLIYVLKYTGLVGFMCFLFPFSLQVRSIMVCKKTFSKMLVSITGNGSAAAKTEGKKELLSPTLASQGSSLFTKRMCEENGMLYMTPYSNNLISRPITVVLVGVAGGILFIIAFSSLFVHPDRVTCD